MKRTARSPRPLFGALALAWLLTVGATVYSVLQHDDHSVTSALLFGCWLTLILIFTAYVVVTRATMDAQRIELHALRKRDRLRSSLDGVVGYHMDREGAWWVHTRTEGTACTDLTERTRVAVLHPWELHRAFVEIAPKKMGGRRMRFPGIPPEEDFQGLWVYDVERLIPKRPAPPPPSS